MRSITTIVLPVVVFLLLGFFAESAFSQVYVFGQASFATGASPSAVISADLDNDGRLDIVTSNLDSNSITILLGKPDGTFATSADYVVGSRPIAVASGDFNSDGILDLAVA